MAPKLILNIPKARTKSFGIRALKDLLKISILFTFLFSALLSYASSNLALHKPVTASSSENFRLTPEYAVDNKMSSRWSSDFSDDNWIAVDLGDLYQITGAKFHWQNSYAKDYHIQTSIDGVNWVTIHTTRDNPGGIDKVALNGAGRYIRMFGLRRATRYGYSLFNFEVYGSPLSIKNVAQRSKNVALNKPARASSAESSSLLANKAVDGDMSSRWSSKFTDRNWISVDLGAIYQITGSQLNWEVAHSKKYDIQTSLDGVNWSTIYSKTNSQGGIEKMTLDARGRYFRVKSYDRATIYGHSLWELKVFGYEIATPRSSVKSKTSPPKVDRKNSSARTDSSAPTKPVKLRADKIALNSVTLNWAAATDDTKVARYILSRDGTDLTELTAPAQTYTDKGLRPATTYSYRLRAGDVAGNWSEQSSILTLSTESPALSRGSGLTLRWTSPRARENGAYLGLPEIGGYEIRYKHRADSEYQVLILEDSTATEYRFGHLRGGYEFEIAVFDTNGLYSQFVPIKPRRH